ncbi:MAG: topoisomerase [Candidatus Saccharibacteria bacterium]|nr:topoisomerase [Candidatus Saccharibacteria bacterium]
MPATATPTSQTLSDLYADPLSCAKSIGLAYIESPTSGVTRQRRGKGFHYEHIGSSKAVDAKTRQRIEALVIPPAWQDVWIHPTGNGHILATGVDEKGRKQYIYHPKWRAMRDGIKFYRMIMFAGGLPKIRRDIKKNLQLKKLSQGKVMAIMLWILDSAYIRIGNDSYFQANESVGLTTLTDRNIVIAGPVVTLAFKGKSGKDQQITFENAGIAKVLNQLRQVKGARLFRYQDAANDWHEIDSDEINKYLHELTGLQISAKDFRTWGGTLMAFMHLLSERAAEEDKKSEKVIIEAVDQAAAVLGNTRSVARSSYVHPHMLDIYGSKDFEKYYARSVKARKVAGLDRNESELLHFLEQLFEQEFRTIKTN